MIEAFHCVFVLAAQSVIRRSSPTLDSVQGPQLDTLALCGFLVSILTLLFFLHQPRSRVGIFSFAVCLLAMAAYGFLQGAWPLAMVVGAWSGQTFWRVKSRVPVNMCIAPIQPPIRAHNVGVRVSETRMRQIFGSSGLN